MAGCLPWRSKLEKRYYDFMISLMKYEIALVKQKPVNPIRQIRNESTT
jgi:hypothetical protein